MNPYYSHQKYLTEELDKLGGQSLILEFGVGDGSSSVLRRLAIQKPKFRIQSYESDSRWFNEMKRKYSLANYCFNHVDSWDEFFEETVFNDVYDLVFVDSSPWEARIQAIEAVRKTAKVIVLHDYNYYNRGVIDNLYCITEGSFFYDRYGSDFILQSRIVHPEILEYPGTLVMIKK